jgi:hypothetical protein
VVKRLTVGLQVFASTDQGIDWSVICAATLMTSAPLLLASPLFQRQFVQSFMRAGFDDGGVGRSGELRLALSYQQAASAAANSACS